MIASLFDDIKLYLPKYLSPESQENLIRELKQFPKNIDERLFYNNQKIDDKIYQGDCIDNLLIFNLPNPKFVKSKGVVISNTCDIDFDNDRKYISPNICYTPIVNLEKYKTRLQLKSSLSKEQIESHISNIKTQMITSVFYLPPFGKLTEESLIMFDRIISINNKEISRENLNERRLFSLGNYGFYLFIFKLSMHLTRMNEGMDRSNE